MVKDDRKTASAVFVPLENSVLQTRRAVRRAILDGQRERSFTIVREEYFYLDFLDNVLSNQNSIQSVLDLSEFVMREDGVARCAALMSMQNHDGVLVFCEQGVLMGSYLPVMSGEEARMEYDCAKQMEIIAERLEGVPVQLNHDITARRTTMRDALRQLLEF